MFEVLWINFWECSKCISLADFGEKKIIAKSITFGMRILEI